MQRSSQSQYGWNPATLKGSGNEGTVSNCMFADIQSNDCKLQVSNCVYSNLTVLASKIKMSNCCYANIQGDNFSICASNCAYLSMDSVENGEFILNDNPYLNWHGKDGLGEIQRDTYTTVDGGQNQLKSKNNIYLSITGNNNKVASVKSQNLSIEGNDNEVLSSNTHYVTVEGDHNNVNVKDIPRTGMRHSLSRVGDNEENELALHKFDGDPDVEVTEMNWNGMTFTSVTYKGPQTFVNGVRIPLNSTANMFSVKLNYQDEASIVGNTYTSGIFQFQLNKLDNDTAQVVVSREGIVKYDVKEMEGADSVVISGERDGKVEKLKISGQKVEVKTETEFEISLNKN